MGLNFTKLRFCNLTAKTNPIGQTKDLCTYKPLQYVVDSAWRGSLAHTSLSSLSSSSSSFFLFPFLSFFLVLPSLHSARAFLHLSFYSWTFDSSFFLFFGLTHINPNNYVFIYIWSLYVNILFRLY